jgi:hypothetical protein
MTGMRYQIEGEPYGEGAQEDDGGSHGFLVGSA